MNQALLPWVPLFAAVLLCVGTLASVAVARFNKRDESFISVWQNYREDNKALTEQIKQLRGDFASLETKMDEVLISRRQLQEEYSQCKRDRDEYKDRYEKSRSSYLILEHMYDTARAGHNDPGMAAILIERLSDIGRGMATNSATDAAGQPLDNPEES